MTYIEKEPLLEKAKKLSGDSFAAPLIITEIDKAPVVDVEKVTRCKDCYNVEALDGTLYCWYFNKNVYEDDFCSNGG
jgi:hypothetical protein